MNYMKNILEDLGVKVGEDFTLQYSDGSFFSSNIYHFSDSYLLLRYGENDSNFVESNAKVLLLMLQGILVIERYDFIPEDGDIFYFPTLGMVGIQLAKFDSSNLLHVLLKKHNMVYESREEATEHFEEDYKTLTGKDYYGER